MNKNQTESGFFSHLTELRKRLIHSLIFLSTLFIICYYFSEYIYGFLVDPYAQAVKNDDINRRLIFTALQETFLTYLKVSFFAAFFFYQSNYFNSNMEIYCSRTLWWWKISNNALSCSYTNTFFAWWYACLLSNNAFSYKIFSVIWKFRFKYIFTYSTRS